MEQPETIRMLDSEAAIFVCGQGNLVIVRVRGVNRVLPRGRWASLPAFTATDQNVLEVEAAE